MGRSIYWQILLGLHCFMLDAAAISNEEVQTTLSDFCMKHKADAFVTMSFSCKLAKQRLPVEPICEQAAKNNTVEKLHLEDLARNFAKATGGTEADIQQKLCAKTQEAIAAAEKPRCEAEANGSGKIQRRWWNGQDWISTTESLKSVQESAAKDDPHSIFNLGQWHENSAPCVEKDIRKAVQFLCRAHDLGFPMAKTALSSMGKDNGFPAERAREALGKRFGCELTEHQKVYAAETKKLEEIAKANLKKAEAGDVRAMLKAAFTYQSDDEGLPQDFKQAFSWAEKAASKDSVGAMALLGSLYGRGDGVEQSNEKAFAWTMKAAQKGDTDSAYVVGLYYYDGTGVEANLTKAVQWLTKAMNGGNNDAKDKLIEMYARGELQAVAFNSINQRLRALEKARKK